MSQTLLTLHACLTLAKAVVKRWCCQSLSRDTATVRDHSERVSHAFTDIYIFLPLWYNNTLDDLFSQPFQMTYLVKLTLHFMPLKHSECPQSSLKGAAGCRESPSIGGKQAWESGWVIEGHVLLHSNEATPGLCARRPRCPKECSPRLSGNVLFISSRPMRGSHTKAFIQLPDHSKNKTRLGVRAAAGFM